jgi:hypothetical protein
MGIDINGWVEFRQPDTAEWGQCIDISLLIDRNYDAFGCLFGVQNYACFAPVAADRALPADISEHVKLDAAEMDGYAFGHSWIGWNELKVLDREEPALAPDERVHQYRYGPAGELIYEGKATWSEDLAALLTRQLDHTVPLDGQEWKNGDRVYRAERLKRRDALGEDWEVLCEMMAALAGRYGDEGVRLVVWFE